MIPRYVEMSVNSLPLLRYWRFREESRTVDEGYPKAVSVWNGIPASIKGAFLSEDGGESEGIFYFFYT